MNPLVTVATVIILLIIIAGVIIGTICLVKKYQTPETYAATYGDSSDFIVCPQVWKHDCKNEKVIELNVEANQVSFPCKFDFAESVNINPINGLYYFPLNDSSECEKVGRLDARPTCGLKGKCGDLGSGLYSYDPNSNIWERVSPYPNNSTVVVGSKFSPDGTIWIGADPGNFGLVYWILGDSEMTAIRHMSSNIENPGSSPYNARYNSTVKMPQLLLGTNDVCFDSNFSDNNRLWIVSNLDNLSLGGVLTTFDFETKESAVIVAGMPACAGICDPGNGYIYIASLLNVMAFNKDTKTITEVCGCMQDYPMYDNITFNPLENMMYITTFSQSRFAYDAIYYLRNWMSKIYSTSYGASYEDVVNMGRTSQKNTKILFITIDLNKSAIGRPTFYSHPGWDNFDLEVTHMLPVNFEEPNKFLLVNFSSNVFVELEITDPKYNRN